MQKSKFKKPIVINLLLLFATVFFAIFGGFFSDWSGIFLLDKLLSKANNNYGVIGGIASPNVFANEEQYLSWKENFESKPFKNVKKAYTSDDGIVFLEASVFELDTRYNSFHVFSTTREGWKKIDEGYIYISSQSFYSFFGHRNYESEIGNSVAIGSNFYPLGGVFMISDNAEADDYVSNYFKLNIGDFVFTGSSFFEENEPSNAIISFELSLNEKGKIYSSISKFVESSNSSFSFFEKKSGIDDLQNKITSIESFYRSPIKIVVSIFLTACWLLLLIVLLLNIRKVLFNLYWELGAALLVFIVCVLPLLFFRRFIFKNVFLLINPGVTLYLFLTFLACLICIYYLHRKTKRLSIFGNSIDEELYEIFVINI